MPDAGPAAARERNRTETDHLPTDPLGTERLRSLLTDRDTWRDHADLGRLTAAIGRAGPVRIVVAGVAAVALGLVAFVVVGGGRTSSVDPVQVLPRVDASATVDHRGSVPPRQDEATRADSPGTSVVRIRAHAAGAVATPGVHALPDGARVADLLDAAGGLTPDADPDRINLAAPVRDGERVYVPRRGESEVPVVVAGDAGGVASLPPAGGSGSGGASTAGPSGATAEPVDVNRADATVLDALPGVGPSTAQAIIRYRSEHGPFRAVDDLLEVPGIGPAKLAQLRDLVRVG